MLLCTVLALARSQYDTGDWSGRGPHLLQPVGQVHSDEVGELLLGQRDALAAHIRPRLHERHEQSGCYKMVCEHY